MERIQTAINKARAQREREQTASEQVLREQPVPVAPALARDAEVPHGGDAALKDGPAPRAAWSEFRPMMPDADHLLRNRIMTLHGGRNSVLYDQLRTKVLQTMRANGWKRLAITSPAPGCGKSTVILNLAFSLARQPDLYTILLEMDLRRPSLGGLLGLRTEKGIASWLEGRIGFAQQAACYNFNLAFALCHQPRSDASDLLLQGRTGAALTQMEERYQPDLMLFDMPPLQANDDMMAFASQVDCVLIVAGAEQSTIKQIDACERDLAQQTNVMGVILNKCTHLDTDSGYGYYDYAK